MTIRNYRAGKNVWRIFARHTLAFYAKDLQNGKMTRDELEDFLNSRTGTAIRGLAEIDDESWIKVPHVKNIVLFAAKNKKQNNKEIY